MCDKGNRNASTISRRFNKKGQKRCSFDLKDLTLRHKDNLILNLSIMKYKSREESGIGDIRRAVVVGASSGIGLEVVKQLLEVGVKTGVAARRHDRLKMLKDEHPDLIETSCIDVTSPDSANLLSGLINRLGGMDLFVYASGYGKENTQLEPSIELQTVETNCMGFTRMLGEAFRFFRSQGHGHIAAITSVIVVKGVGSAPSYSATKAMQSAYLQALEQQISSQKLDIHISDIRPGFVDTDFIKGGRTYPMQLSPNLVAHRLLRAVRKNRHVCIIDWRYKVLTSLWRMVPNWVWRRMHF